MYAVEFLYIVMNIYEQSFIIIYSRGKEQWKKEVLSI